MNFIITGSTRSSSVLQCDPSGPFKSCGGNMLFDSKATCQKSDATISGGISWCTQVHCCKSVSHEVMLENALSLNGTLCNCNVPWPCVSVDHGGCMGSGNHRKNVDVITQCWNKDTPNKVPCIGDLILIPTGK